MSIVDFDFSTGEKALFNFVDGSGTDQHAIVRVHDCITLNDEKAYLVSAPANILRGAFDGPDFCAETVPLGWWLVLVDPDELEPVKRVLRTIGEEQQQEI